jgi:hypothetical protein
MAFSVLIAAIGIFTAQKFYVKSPRFPNSSPSAGRRAPAAVEQVLRRRAVQRDRDLRHLRRGRGLWTVDRNVVDGAVNGPARSR